MYTQACILDLCIRLDDIVGSHTYISNNILSHLKKVNLFFKMNLILKLPQNHTE